MANQVKELQQLVVRLIGEGSDYKKTLDEAVRQTEKSTGKIDKLTGKLSRSMDSISMSVKKVGSSIRRMGTFATAGLTLPIIGAGIFLGKAAADFERVSLQFGVMLGRTQGSQMIKDLQQFSKATPFQFGGLAASTRTLLAFGVAQEDVMGSLKMLGDVSAGTGKNLNELAVIFGQIRGMGRLQGQDFLQLVNAGFPVSEIAKVMQTDMKGLKDLMAEGRVPFEAVAQAMKNTTAEGGIFNNMMEQISKTAVGTWSTMVDEIKLVSIELGKILLPFVKELIDRVRSWVSWFGKLSTETKKLLLLIAGIVAVTGPLIIVVGSTLVAAGAIIGVIATKVALITAGVVALGAALWGVANSILGPGGVNDAFEKALDVGLDFGKKVIGFVMNIGHNFEALLKWLRGNWRNVLDDIFSMWKTFTKNHIHNMMVHVGTLIRLFTLWRGFMLGVWKRVFSIEFLKWAVDGVKKVGRVLLDFVNAAWEGLKSIFTGGGDRSELRRMVETVVGDFQKGMKSGNILADAADIVKEQVGLLRGPLEGFKSSIDELPNFRFDIPGSEDEVTPKTQKTPEAPEFNIELPKLDGLTVPSLEQRQQDFRQIAINRISVAGLVGHRLPRQEMNAPGIEKRLDELIDVSREKQNVAVLEE